MLTIKYANMITNYSSKKKKNKKKKLWIHRTKPIQENYGFM